MAEEQRLAVAGWERERELEMDWSANGWSGRYRHSAIAGSSEDAVGGR